MLTCTTLLVVGLLSHVVPAAEPPNIIFFLADDQRSDVLGCAGHPVVKTPTLDRLAAEGVRFENSFCQVPICAGSRATLFSGLSQRTHGYNFEEPKVAADYIATSYPAVLKAAGYRIGFVGKYGMAFAPPGLKKQFGFFRKIGREPYLKKQPDGSLRHETDLCADAAIAFLQSNPPDTPFCLSVSFNAPHAEDKDLRPGFHFQWPESTDGLYDDLTLPTPALSDPGYFEALPPFLQNKAGLNRLRYYWRWDTAEKYQVNLRAYFRMITGIDNAIARVQEALETQAFGRDTILVYSADNGYMMGDRGTAGKWNHYDQSVRIPLIIYDPRLPEDLRGRVVSELVSNLDMAPTFVDWAGAGRPNIYQGRSLVPLMQGQPPGDWREEVFLEHHFKHFNNWHAVRSRRYKYAVYYEEPGGPYPCLYDLEQDPAERINLVANPEYDTVLNRMKGRLVHYLADYPKASAAAVK